MQLASVVSEREQGLRQALTTSGMLDSAFWVSWLVVEASISVLFSLLIIAFGAAFGFAFFLNNSFAIIFLLFLLFQWAMVGLAFIVSAFISQTTTAINLGFVIFIIGWIVQAAVDFNFPYSPNYYSSMSVLTAIFTLLPFATLTKASVDLGAATTSTAGGIPWSRRNAYCQNIQSPAAQDAMFATDPEAYWDFNCVFPIGNILAILAIEAFVYALVAVYLDNVFAASNGVRKPLWYFLSPQYWFGSSKSPQRLGKGSSSPKRKKDILVQTPLGYREIRATKEVNSDVGVEADQQSTDPDVMAEEVAMRQLLMDRAEGLGSGTQQADDMNAVELFGLQKSFRVRSAWWSSIVACCSCMRRNKKSRSKQSNNPNKNRLFWAIQGSWFSIKRDRLFCLLGPNGAGKTTTINCLTGVLPPSGGGALVYGESITAPGGLDRIRAIMGVCPQFDVLWPELTAEEHMYIYGRVKGLSRGQVTVQTQGLLENVKLTGAASQRTQTFSGGMKRRLSVAVALLGDPLLVFLDEPTTGMDPISRRHVWDAIEDAKQGRAIVLTTHSMEEADILGDEIAIMARGKLRAYGTSLRLKQRFGSGYQLAVAVEDDARHEEIRRLFMDELGVSSASEGLGRYSVFHVPKEKESILSEFLKRIEAEKNRLGITDIQISLTSLEEVFLNIAKQAEIEAALAEGRDVVTITLEDGAVLEVSMGEEYGVRQDTGEKYSITWAQDEEGRLQVSSWKLVEAGGTSS